MSEKMQDSKPTNQPLPLILIRGFGGLSVEDEKRIAYQGFNDGTVYPQKRGENYIYEGLVLRFMKSHWTYHDATNVIGYYPRPENLSANGKSDFHPDQVAVDPAMKDHLLRTVPDPFRTLWVFRYYDLNNRTFPAYGQALLRLIDFIRGVAEEKTNSRPRVNIIAHSMGGLIVREVVQRTYPERKAQDPNAEEAWECINKIVTLGTPHRGITFQVVRDWLPLGAEKDLEHFNPEFQRDASQKESYTNFHKCFPVQRMLTVVGTNYKTYSVAPASWMNRLFSVSGEFGTNYNRSDGLVKQTSAQIDGCPRTFVHKCHGGVDSLVTSREAFEVATRFFYGNIRARLRLVSAEITRGADFFGKSEFFLGVSIKPRKVDFELFHQSAEAENCYGPFHATDLTDTDAAFGWAGPNRLLWEGWLDISSILEDKSIENDKKDMVLRVDFYVGERDLKGIGFSDNVIFRKQYYLRALLSSPLKLFRHTDERFRDEHFQIPKDDHLTAVNGGWQFPVKGTGFEGVFRIELDDVPKIGEPTSKVAQAELAPAD